MVVLTMVTEEFVLAFWVRKLIEFAHWQTNEFYFSFSPFLSSSILPLLFELVIREQCPYHCVAWKKWFLLAMRPNQNKIKVRIHAHKYRVNTKPEVKIEAEKEIRAQSNKTENTLRKFYILIQISKNKRHSFKKK